MKIERNIRTRENNMSSAIRFLLLDDEQERTRQYNGLYESMKKDITTPFPIDIMLLRMMGIKNTVNQGHHRMGNCPWGAVCRRLRFDSALPAAPRKFSNRC